MTAIIVPSTRFYITTVNVKVKVIKYMYIEQQHFHHANLQENHNVYWTIEYPLLMQNIQNKRNIT